MEEDDVETRRALAGMRIHIAGANPLEIDFDRTARSPGDNRVCQREIGEGWQTFLSRVFRTAAAEQSEGRAVMSVTPYEITVLWWMGRRKNGEPGLRYAAHEAEIERRLDDGTFAWDQLSIEPVYGEPEDDEEGEAVGAVPSHED